MSVVPDLLRSADLDSFGCRYAGTAAPLSVWRDTFLAGGEVSLKVRQEDPVAGQGHRLKSVTPELAMDNELLKGRIRRTEDANLSVPWRSKK